MRVRTILITALVALAAMAVGAATAGAQGPTFKPGEFEVNVEPPESGPMGKEPDCTPSIDAVMEKMMGGATSVDMVCTMDESANGLTMQGTVSNPSLAATYGDAFTNGTITQTCDMVQKMQMGMRMGMGSTKLISMKGSMFQYCNWKMTFPDDKGTTLSGTMEMNGKAGRDDGSVDESGDVEMSMTMNIFVTGGTGIFEGYVGTGSFEMSESVPMGPQDGEGDGGPEGDGPQGGGSPPPEVCQALGLPTGCSVEQLEQACQANPASCSSFGPPAGRSRATRQEEDPDGMMLTLYKAPGQVRIISPVSPAGAPGTAAKITATTKVEVVATQGAKCTVKTNKGAVVGQATSKDSAKVTVIRARKGAYKGAASIIATCTKDGKTFKSARSKITL